MAILTKPLSGLHIKRPEDNLPADKLIDDAAVAVAEEDEVDHLYRRVTRVGRMTNCCLLVSLIALLILGIGAGVHSYKVFVLRNTYAGMCRLPLRDFSEQHRYIKERLTNMQESPFRFQNTFEFDFDIDVEEENYEVLELPEIFLGRYMHDFNENLTVIIDSLRGRCYIMPLDRSVIPVPKDMFDMILKLQQGVYDVNYTEIKKNFRALDEEITDLEEFGYLVPRACSQKKTYRLEELVGDERLRREAEDKLEKYGEFTGTNLVQYHILESNN